MKSLLGAAWKPPKSPAHVFCRWRSKSSSRPSGPLVRRIESKASFDYKALRQNLQDEGAKHERPKSHAKRNYQLFQRLVATRLDGMLQELGSFTENKDQWRIFGVQSQAHLDSEIGLFKMAVKTAFSLAADKGKTGRQENPLFWNLRNGFLRSELHFLARELRFAFQTFLMRSRFPTAVNELHRALADLRFPYEWFPATRAMQRTIHLHVGPTNSGKTYNALKALENARTGIYAGPLRLLAHEVWNRFTAKNKSCALITGEEMRIPADSDLWFRSCTVEMTPLNAKVDVAVIDEIQMMSHDERGWAWTQAFLGVQAKEVHLCGEERVVELIQHLCRRLGEKCIVHRYKRLNPLQIMPKSLDGKFSNLRKGDALVAFSRLQIHQLKAGIEAATRRRCAIVYGSLPPETRAGQAALFNDPDNDYDYLVASDAIGMGLNLEIKRVIFFSSAKFDGVAFRSLTVPEIKQIGGRAGRYRTAAQDISGRRSEPSPGLITTLDDEDLFHITESFETEVGPLKTAGLFPPAAVIERFHSYFPPGVPLSFVIARLRELARLSPQFYLCDFSVHLEIAETLQDYDMSVSDRCVFLNAPVSFRDDRQVRALRAFAQCVAEMRTGDLLSFKDIDFEVLEAKNNPRAPTEQRSYLRRLESLHHVITLYLWLSYRYEGVFQSQHLAFKVKEMVEEKINEHLENQSFVAEVDRSRRRRMRRLAEETELKERTLLGSDEDEAPVPHDEEGHEEPLFEDGEDEVGDVASPDQEPKDQPASAHA